MSLVDKVRQIIGGVAVADGKELDAAVEELRAEIGKEYYEGRGDDLMEFVAQWIENFYSNPSPDKRQNFMAEYRHLCKKHGCYVANYDDDFSYVCEGNIDEALMWSIEQVDEFEQRHQERMEESRKRCEAEAQKRIEYEAQEKIGTAVPTCNYGLIPWYGPGSPWGESPDKPKPQWESLPGWPRFGNGEEDE